MPLPFLRIPELCQLDIIEQLEFPDLFCLSTCSQTTMQLLQKAKLPPMNFHFLSVEKDRFYLVVVDSEKDVHVVFTVNFQDKRVGGGEDELEWNGLEGLQFSENCGRFNVYSSDNKQTMADQLISHLRRLLQHSKPDKLTIWPTNLTKRVVENHFRKVGKLKFYDESKRELAREHLLWIMDTVEVTEHLKVECEVREMRNKPKYRKGFKARKVTITNPHWVHQKAIINSQTETFKLYHVSPSTTFINTILKRWITNSKLQNLKELDYTLDTTLSTLRFTEEFQNMVMKKLEQATLTADEQKRWDAMEKGKFCRFIRRIDGKVAVVIVNSDEFKFRVL